MGKIIICGNNCPWPGIALLTSKVGFAGAGWQGSHRYSSRDEFDDRLADLDGRCPIEVVAFAIVHHKRNQPCGNFPLGNHYDLFAFALNTRRSEEHTSELQSRQYLV